VSRVSSGSIVSVYGLDDRSIGVRSPAGAKNFPLSSVQTCSGAHPASCTMGTGGPFPGGKARPGRDANHSPHLEPRSRMSRSYTSLPPSALVPCSGTTLEQWYSTFFFRVPPDIISLQLCTPMLLVHNSSYIHCKIYGPPKMSSRTPVEYHCFRGPTYGVVRF
jgi:hypothetical protein